MYVNLGATGNVVTRLLTNGECDGKGHVLVMDRYYNSVTLFHHLHAVHQTGAVGTVQTNRKFFPAAVKTAKVRERGDVKSQCHENIAALVWKDRKPIFFLSNVHDPHMIINGTLRRNKDGTQTPLPMPEAVSVYNKYMGGCDLNDQMTRLQRTRPETLSLATSTFH